MDHDLKQGAGLSLVAGLISSGDDAATRKELIKRQSFLARRALRKCADLNGIRLGTLSQDQRGAPLPDNGNYWSVSHKPGAVAAVCAPLEVGIDIERIRPRNESLFDYIADRKEWSVTGKKNWPNFFRIFTAKEAAIKATGAGIADLSRVRISLPREKGFVLDYSGRQCYVSQELFGDYIVSVATFSPSCLWIFRIEDIPDEY